MISNATIDLLSEYAYAEMIAERFHPVVVAMQMSDANYLRESQGIVVDPFQATIASNTLWACDDMRSKGADRTYLLRLALQHRGQAEIISSYADEFERIWDTHSLEIVYRYFLDGVGGPIKFHGERRLWASEAGYLFVRVIYGMLDQQAAGHKPHLASMRFLNKLMDEFSPEWTIRMIRVLINCKLMPDDFMEKANPNTKRVLQLVTAY